uniref:Uncharacterized protein n=1 Tax=Rhizophora mucronata TaxID=61149 RepID=A0A2P2R1M1_RHIMU
MQKQSQTPQLVRNVHLSHQNYMYNRKKKEINQPKHVSFQITSHHQ